ncbi:MAG: DUF6560 family protein [Lachnospiraceae bacterium]|jgi:hypothetical protein
MNLLGQLIALIAVIVALFVAMRGVSGASKRKGEELRKTEVGQITALQPNLMPLFLVLSVAVSVLLVWLLVRAVMNGSSQVVPYVIYIVLLNACAILIGVACKNWKLVLKGDTAEYRDWFGRNYTYSIPDIDECRVSRRRVYTYYSKGKQLFSMSGTDASGEASMVMGTINSRRAIRYLTTYSIPIIGVAEQKAKKQEQDEGIVRPTQNLGILRLTAVGTAAMATRYLFADPMEVYGVALFAAACAACIVGLIYYQNDKTWIEGRTIFQKKWFSVHKYPYVQIRSVERDGDSLIFFNKAGKKLFSVNQKYDGYEKFEQEIRRNWRIR